MIFFVALPSLRVHSAPACPLLVITCTPCYSSPHVYHSQHPSLTQQAHSHLPHKHLVLFLIHACVAQWLLIFWMTDGRQPSFEATVAALPRPAQCALASLGATSFADVAGCTEPEWAALAPPEPSRTAWAIACDIIVAPKPPRHMLHSPCSSFDGQDATT